MTACSYVSWYRVIPNILNVLSKQFQNKRKIEVQMIICICWELSQNLSKKTFLDFLQFNGLVAFVFNKNNEKLISLMNEKKKSENIILSNLLQRNFSPSFLSVQSCLRYGSQYQSGNIWPKEIKVRRYEHLMNGLPLSACNCYYKLNRKVPFQPPFWNNPQRKRSGSVTIKPQSLSTAVDNGCHQDSRVAFTKIKSQEVFSLAIKTFVPHIGVAEFNSRLWLPIFQHPANADPERQGWWLK